MGSRSKGVDSHVYLPVQPDEVHRFGILSVDAGTIAAYWETNLALLKENPALDLYDPTWVIRTRSRERPPVKCKPPGEIDNSLLSNGCVINGTMINSVLSPGVRIERGVVCVAQ